MSTKRVTVDQVKSWLGSDMTRNDMIELLTDLVNGDYALESFLVDVITNEELDE